MNSRVVGWFLTCAVTLLTACNTDPSSPTENAESIALYTDTAKPRAPCGHGAARVDRQQLLIRLKAKGVVTEQMTQQQAERILNDYIKQRQQTFNRCIKEPKP